MFMNPLNIPNKFLNNFTALTRIINRFTGISQPLSCFPPAGWLPTVLIISSVRINISEEDALRRPVLRNRILVSYVLLPVEGSESVSSMKYLSDTRKLIKRIFQTYFSNNFSISSCSFSPTVFPFASPFTKQITVGTDMTLYFSASSLS